MVLLSERLIVSGFGFRHPDSPSVEYLPVQLSDGSVCIGSLSHLHEGKPTGLPGHPIGDHVDGENLSHGPEQVAQRSLGGRVIQISNV